jgi:hypothetical protein
MVVHRQSHCSAGAFDGDGGHALVLGTFEQYFRLYFLEQEEKNAVRGKRKTHTGCGRSL